MIAAAVPAALAAAALAMLLWLPPGNEAVFIAPAELVGVAAAWLVAALAAADLAREGRPLAPAGGAARWLLPALAGWIVLACLAGPRPAYHLAYAVTGLSGLVLAGALTAWLDGGRRRAALYAVLLGVVGWEVVVALLQAAFVPYTPPGAPISSPVGLPDYARTLWITTFGPHVPVGTLGNPVFLAEFLALAAPPGLAWLAGRGRGGAIAAAVLAPLAFAVAVLAAARAALVGLALGALWLVPPALRAWPALDGRRRAALVGAPVLAVALAFGLGASVAEKFENVRYAGSGLTIRVANWRAAGTTFAAHPVFGAGPGGVLLTQSDAMEAADLTPAERASNVFTRFHQLHDEPLQAFVELGAPGGLLVLALAGAWALALARRADLPGLERAGLAMGATAAAAAGCFGFPLHIPLTGLAAAIVFALGLGGDRPLPAPGPAPGPARPAAAVAAAALCAIAGLLAVFSGPWRSYLAGNERLWADVALARGEYASASLLYGAAARYERMPAFDLGKRVYALALAGRDDAALAAYEAARHEPMGVEVQFVVAGLYARKGDRAAAKAAYARVVRNFGPDAPMRREAEARLRALEGSRP